MKPNKTTNFNFLLFPPINHIKNCQKWNKIDYQDEAIQMQPGTHLLLRLQTLTIAHPSPSPTNSPLSYISFSLTSEPSVFSSAFSSQNNVVNFSDDLILTVQETGDELSLYVCRWNNHMLMFTHQIDVSQLKSRNMTKKVCETKTGQILHFTVQKLQQNQIKFGNKRVDNISQHYLIIKNVGLKGNISQNRQFVTATYFVVKTSGNHYILPITNGEICVKLPQTLQFQYFADGKIQGKSQIFRSNEFGTQKAEIQIVNSNGNKNIIVADLKWGINFYQTKAENSLLLQAHQLLIYDIEVKFDSYTEYANARIKFVYGNKGFQIGGEFNTSKPSKIRKIIFVIIKSEDEEISIVVQKNLKTVAQSKFYTDEITPFQVHNPKRKLLDDNGKVVGQVKFRCEKGKNLSTPSNNRFWKESSKKKMNNMILLSIQQISVEYEKNEPFCVILKSQSQQRQILNVPNMKFFDRTLQVSFVPVVISSKPQDNVYMMIKDQNQITQKQSNDFIGIAILNFSQMKMGTNCASIPFFKNQVRTATVNCIINKVTSYPFIKSNFQPEIMSLTPHKTTSLTILLKKTLLTPYLYTYRYDNKSQLYCIIEANRLKKVLIMQSSAHNQLSLLPSSSSDSLNFYIQQCQFIKIKITFLVSDIGYQQEIYGSAQVKVKVGELQERQKDGGIIINKVEIKNDFGTEVGVIGLEVHPFLKKNQMREKEDGPFKSQIKKVQNDIDKINYNMEIVQNSIKKKSKSPFLRRSQQHKVKLQKSQKKQSIRYNNQVDYGNRRKQRNHSVMGTNSQSIKLPTIKAKKNDNLKDLISMMKIRKRGTRGYIQQNSLLESYVPKYPVSQRAIKNENKTIVEPKFHTQKNSRDSQIQRNSQLIFPKDKKAIHQNLKRQIEQYEQKIKGLKSAIDEYEQPPVYQQNHALDQMMLKAESNERPNKDKKQDDEIQGNQFVIKPE